MCCSVCCRYFLLPPETPNILKSIHRRLCGALCFSLEHTLCPTLLHTTASVNTFIHYIILSVRTTRGSFGARRLTYLMSYVTVIMHRSSQKAHSLARAFKKNPYRV